MAAQKLPFHSLIKEHYYAIVKYKYARKGLPDHRANSGIGKATALGLAQMCTTVVMVCRDRARGEEAQREIKMKSGNDAVDLLLADLSSQQSIRQLADTIRQRYPYLHVLINNAGAGFTQRQESVDGVEMTFAVNYLAPFLLTNLLLDVLINSAPARIINVGSDNHRFARLDMQDLQLQRRYGFLRAYGRSKLALLLFTYELARQLQGTGITVNALEPGPTSTGFGQRGASPVARLLLKLASSLFKSPEQGAQTSLYLASSPAVETITGKYFVKSAPKRSSSLSYNESFQHELWEESTRLVKLPAKITSVVKFFGGFHARVMHYEGRSPGHEAFSLSQT